MQSALTKQGREISKPGTDISDKEEREDMKETIEILEMRIKGQERKFEEMKLQKRSRKIRCA